MRHRIASSLIPLLMALALPARPVGGQEPATTPVAAPKPPPGYAGSRECTQCHKEAAAKFAATPKGKLFLQHPQDAQQQLGCESCHGPAKLHAQTGGEERGGLVSFGHKAPSPVAVRNATCLSCHAKTARTLWTGSAHQTRNVACTDCHTIMHATSERADLRKESVLATCGSCHAKQRAQQIQSSHMPLGQGKMDCTSCHNPHGTANPKLLLASSTNETCFSCHADKRGPHLWEHAPVVENCANCHDPHGSNKEKMLKVARPRLCQQCHAGTGHPTQPRIVTRAADLPFVFNRSCSNCHFNIHGSNHPAGAFFTR